MVSTVDLVLYDTFSQLQADAMQLDDVVTDPDARVVVLSWNTDDDLVRRAVAAGAAGYVTKALTAAELVDALERIHAGEQVVSLGAVSDPADEILGRWPGEKHGISPRESEVLALICQGLTNEDITGRAFITINTVKSHIRSVYRKIGVTTRSQAVRWGLEHGFAPDRTRIVAAPPHRLLTASPLRTTRHPQPAWDGGRSAFPRRGCHRRAIRARTKQRRIRWVTDSVDS